MVKKEKGRCKKKETDEGQGPRKETGEQPEKLNGDSKKKKKKQSRKKHSRHLSVFVFAGSRRKNTHKVHVLFTFFLFDCPLLFPSRFSPL